MCMGLYYKDKYVSNQYELANLIGKKNIVMHEGEHIRGKCCLCPVDFRKTAEKINCSFEYTDSQMDAVFIPKVSDG